MQNRYEFRVDRWHALNVGIGHVVLGAAFFVWYWWAPVTERWDGSQKGEMWKVFCGLLAVGFGLLELTKLGSRKVQVAIDRDGITDVRVSDVPVPWSAVEQIDHVPLRQAYRYGRIGGLRLVLRNDPDAHLRHPLRGELLVWDHGLTGGPRALRLAITLLAPQVPRDWNV